MAHKFRYVPVVRWKGNDRTALAKLSSQGRADVMPVIQLWPNQFKGSRATKAPKKGRLPTPAEFFAKQVADAWGTEPFFVDASELFPDASPLVEISDTCVARALQPVPVIGLTSHPNYQAAAKKVVAARGLGIGLRLSLSEMTAAAAWAPRWPYRVDQTDLLIDLGGSVSDVAALGVSVSNAFASLHAGGEWRSVTLLGCCIPQTLTGYNLGATRIDRRELALWQQISGSSLPYSLDFGDYGSIAPGPPIDIDFLTPINAKYTLPDQFMIFRGVKIKGPGAMPMDKQLRGYANEIVRLGAKRHALAHCWADGQIDAIAKSLSPGNPGVWVGLNLNRHIEITRHHLP